MPAIEASGSFEGAPFTVQQWLPGRPVVAAIERGPWWIWRLGRSFGRLQAQLHSLSPEEMRRPPGSSWTGDLSPLDEPALIPLAESVREAAVEDAFCHLDFHPLNVLAERGRISALLDFPNAALADRRADLARTQTILECAPVPPGPLSPLVQFLRGQFLSSWRRGYEAEAGSRIFPIEPIFATWGAATFYADQKGAYEEARGWGGGSDVERVRLYLIERIVAAGFTPGSSDPGRTAGTG
ncbi:MAG: aminoglycoside phosphotransferase family protein [Dehalococcoidia bacterium]|nr:aminoglycoside phosphotransferase family protein [Dehalococcoidia bacterium]